MPSMAAPKASLRSLQSLHSLCSGCLVRKMFNSHLAPTTRSLSTTSTSCADDYAFLGYTDRARSNAATSIAYRPPPKPHRLYVYATRHNCHLTLTTGARHALISVSSGNLNFRKAARGTYDAAFQLGSFVMAKAKNIGLLDEGHRGIGGPMKRLEVVFRDFGPGREAITKLLLGHEGREFKPRITRIMDNTRIKFGGTRGKKPRRLG